MRATQTELGYYAIIILKFSCTTTTSLYTLISEMFSRHSNWTALIRLEFEILPFDMSFANSNLC